MGYHSTITLMVLNILLNFLLLISPVEAAKNTKSSKEKSSKSKKAGQNREEIYMKILKQARVAHQKGKYRESNMILKKYFKFDEREINTPAIVLVLVASNFEKLGNFREAIRYETIYINRKFKKVHDQVIKSVESGNLKKLPDVPSKLQSAYGKKAELYSKLYRAELRNGEERLAATVLSKVKLYHAICEQMDEADCSYSEKMVDEASAKEELKQQQVFKKNWYASFSYLSWQDPLTVKNLSTNANFDFLATTQAYCLGAGYIYENDFYEYGFYGCWALGTATVGDNNDGVTLVSYNQSGVGVTSLFLGPSFHWKPSSRDVSLGVSLAIRYRMGDYTDFTDSGDIYQFQDKNLYSYGGFLEAKYDYERWEFVSKLGMFTQLESLMWVLQGNYFF
ncbi:MAG: hypothetical protein JNM93_12790 [Bacteriovoracaceae bacterium]|nr:hypothetical protein [Bacteriovoracaceae bacterium]